MPPSIPFSDEEATNSRGVQRTDNNKNYGSVEPTTLTETLAASPHKSSSSSSDASSTHDMLVTLAGIAGNVLEWYDFAVFGCFGDVIGHVFFPPQQGHTQTVQSFAVFGLAFFMRPIGGLLMGWIGDVVGRREALVVSIFLMAVPTFLMGCLPTYEQVGPLAIWLLVATRLLQGLSVGGQLMSSLVFTLEGREHKVWGFYGSFVMVATNVGSLIGNFVALLITRSMTREEVYTYGWRLPFLAGILVSIPGAYLHWWEEDDEAELSHKVNTVHLDEDSDFDDSSSEEGGNRNNTTKRHSEHDNLLASLSDKPLNPLTVAFSKENFHSLMGACLVPMLWAGGGYFANVWMSIYMRDLSDHPIDQAFLINVISITFSFIIFFPYAGHLSDVYGRVRVMSIGGILTGVLSPLIVYIIGQGNFWSALVAQIVLGCSVSLWGSPMCAWLAESFDPVARLTSAAIGYNMSQAIAGGTAPALATWMVDRAGVYSPGWINTILAVISLIGLWYVAPERSEVVQIHHYKSPKFKKMTANKDFDTEQP